MAIPDFSDDPATERLASYFEELYEYLVEQGVPEECLPSPWHVLRRVTKAIDHELLREWLDAYATVEAEIQDEDEDEDDAQEEPSHRQRPRRRARPSYLRALDGDAQVDPGCSEEAGEEEADEEPASQDDGT